MVTVMPDDLRLQMGEAATGTGCSMRVRPSINPPIHFNDTLQGFAIKTWIFNPSVIASAFVREKWKFICHWVGESVPIYVCLYFW